MALTEAKENGRNRFVIANSETFRKAETSRLESKAQRALKAKKTP
jgi:hypothetical protein